MTRSKITLYTAIVIGLFMLMVGKSIGQPDGWLFNDKGEVSVADYIALHAAGSLALAGLPEAAYDRKAHRKAQDESVGRDSNASFPYAYPPTYFPIAALFAALPYVIAVVAFPLLTLALFAATSASISASW